MVESDTGGAVPARSPGGGGGGKGNCNMAAEGAWFTGNQAAHPGVPGRGAEGVRELLWAAAGRRGASPGFIYAPLGTIFSTFVGSPGARIGFSGAMDLRKLD